MKLSRFFTAITQIAGVLFIALIALLIISPQSVADAQGYFWQLYSNSSINSVNKGKATYLLNLRNVDKTARFTTDSAGTFVAAGGGTITGASVLGTSLKASTFAKLDSFSTTAATDTVVQTGAVKGDIVIVQKLIFDYSTTVDSSIYVAEAITDKIVVSRAAKAAGGVLKSGAHYDYIWLKK